MPDSAASLPTRESLSKEYGFEVPDAFVTVVRLATEGESQAPKGGLRGLFAGIRAPARKQDEDPALFYEDVCNLILKPNFRYQQTPPELFPIGNMGVDGVHYGYVIRAPEIPMPDYPMGQLCPIDGDGVQLLGRDTREAFENMLSFGMESRRECEDEFEPGEIKAFRRRVAAISSALQISPHPSKASRRYGPGGNGQPVLPEVPIGWRHAPTSDGVGVLAGSELFGADGLTMPDPNDPSAFVDQGQRALETGFPAAALAYFREGYWHCWTDQEWVQPLAQRMSECYRRLGRPSLAEVLERNVADFTSTRD
jgi:hypothetical protein